MATLDIDALVLADLRALASIAPAVVYEDDEAPMEDQIPSVGGQIVAHVIFHSGSAESSKNGRGIVGVELDPIQNYFITEVVAPNKAIAKKLGDRIVQRLLGRKFSGATALELGPRQMYRSVSNESNVPNTYHYAALFRYITNL